MVRVDPGPDDKGGNDQGIGTEGGEVRAEYGQDRAVPDELQTDAADWDPVVKLISMVCVRADPDGGGRSRVLDIDTFRAKVRARLESQMLESLALRPAPWLHAPYGPRESGLASRLELGAAAGFAG